MLCYVAVVFVSQFMQFALMFLCQMHFQFCNILVLFSIGCSILGLFVTFMRPVHWFHECLVFGVLLACDCLQRVVRVQCGIFVLRCVLSWPGDCILGFNAVCSPFVIHMVAVASVQCDVLHSFVHWHVVVLSSLLCCSVRRSI